MNTTKTFRVDARIRNNLLIKAREALGHKTAAEAARALGVSYISLVGYEALSDSPWRKQGGWKPSAVAIATAYKVVPELLWPDEIGGVKRTRTSMEIDAPAAFLEAPQTAEERMLDGSRLDVVESAMDLLSPRQRLVLNHRFGLDGSEPMVLSEIAEKVLNCHRERVRQIEVEALKIIREHVGADGEPKTQSVTNVLLERRKDTALLSKLSGMLQAHRTQAR